MDSKRKVIMALSGGMDSSTVLAYLLDMGYEVECLNFTYGSKHNIYEIKSAELIAKYYKVKYTLIDLTNAFSGFKSNLLKSGGEIPEGHYENDNMALTVVPGRNSIFSCILMGYAESVNAGKIALGVHKGDHVVYPDCRQEYIKALDTMIYLASDKKVEVITPFIDVNKTEICKIGLDLKVPYELTRTCYKNQELSCGKCGSCFERLEAFEENNATDPIPYENAKQKFKTIEGITTAIELIKEQLKSVDDTEKIIDLSNQLFELNNEKNMLENIAKDDLGISFNPEKDNKFIEIIQIPKKEEKKEKDFIDDFDLTVEQIERRKITLENELVKKTNLLETCKKEKNRKLLKEEINQIKEKLRKLNKELEEKY